jgi:hypothetical protein
MTIRTHRIASSAVAALGFLALYVAVLLYILQLRNNIELSVAQGIGQLVQAAQIIRGQ